ncbi:hypothetical protein HDU92_002715 [Lobulomyces angularis]|nr:hypothetical protein HDU92_002715 [Lobulomyces angularis]
MLSADVNSKNLNYKLNSMYVDLLDLIDQYQALQLQIKDNQNEAFFNLALAKLSMGTQNSITSLQYDKRELKPSSVVKYSKNSFQLLLNAAQYSDDEREEDDNENLKITKTEESDFGLRKRINHNKVYLGVMEVNDSCNNCSSEEEEKLKKKIVKEKKKRNDPLNWFGILISNSLRESQKEFKNSLSLIIELANCSLKINNLKEEYVNLLAEFEHMQLK